jgi:hypothetical protein
MSDLGINSWGLFRTHWIFHILLNFKRCLQYSFLNSEPKLKWPRLMSYLIAVKFIVVSPPTENKHGTFNFKNSNLMMKMEACWALGALVLPNYHR